MKERRRADEAGVRKRLHAPLKSPGPGRIEKGPVRVHWYSVRLKPRFGKKKNQGAWVMQARLTQDNDDGISINLCSAGLEMSEPGLMRGRSRSCQERKELMMEENGKS